MTIETELTKLVTIYAKYDNEKKCYVSNLDKVALLRLDRDFAKLLNQQLLTDGPDTEKISKRYKKISLYFHTDREKFFLPEVKWLEYNLSEEGKNNGTCFKSLLFCYKKLTTPEKFKESSFGDVKNTVDLKKWLENLKNQSSTYTGRSLYESLIGLLDQSALYFNESGQIQPKGIRFLVKTIPLIFATYGAFILANELFAIYALFFILLKGGQYMEKGKSNELQIIGRTLKEISIITATAATTLLVRLLEITFYLSRQCLGVSLQIGSVLFTPLLEHPPAKEDGESDSVANLCRDLVIASTIKDEKRPFNTPELQVISAPFQAYLPENTSQFFGGLRIGNEKRKAVVDFLSRMRFLDLSPEPIAEKLFEASKELNKIRIRTDIYTNRTADAVNKADQIITLLREFDIKVPLIEQPQLKEEDTSNMQLVVYNH